MNFSSLVVMAACMVGPVDTWPSFLGQGATPIVSESIPLSWSPSENIAWTAKLPGKGQSSPVIWGDKVFVTSIEGSMKDKCHLVALSLVDGHELWRKTFDSPQTIRSNYFQSRSAPTPVVDGDRVYAFFETGVLVACNHAGDIAWQRDLIEEYGPIESNIGLASSPILVDGVLTLLVDHEGPSYILGVNPQNGENCWKSDRTSRASYASPSVVSIAGKNQIVCSSAGSVDGYDPQTGEQLWTYEQNVGGNRSGAALAFGDGLFTVGASPGMHNEKEEEAKNTNFLMKVELVDGKYSPKVLWKTDEAMPSFNSPMVHAGYAYWVNRVGVVYCFDQKTGEKCYTNRTNGVCWATPVGLGDRIYIFGKDGKTTVIATGPEFKVLAENQLWDPDKVGNDTLNRERSRRGGASGGHGDHPPAAGGGGEAAKPAAAQPAETPADAATAPAARPAEAPAAPSGDSAGRGAGGRPAMSDAEREANRAAGENRFADPVQYGVAIVNGSLVIRSGEVVYCVRAGHAKTVAK